MAYVLYFLPLSIYYIDRVGWRKSSRKIILLATDGDYHNALDGKLGTIHKRRRHFFPNTECPPPFHQIADVFYGCPLIVGILHPNDGNCHLGQDGYHTKSKYLDYPSVSQINYVAKQVNFVLIN